MPEVRWVGKKRKRQPEGVYVMCRRNSLLWFQCRGCRDCGGDGYRRVGTKRKGRKRGGGKRAAVSLVGAGVLFTYLGNTLGTIGQVLAITIIVLVIVLKVVAYIVNGFGKLIS